MTQGLASRRRFLHLGGALACGGALLAHDRSTALASLLDDPTVTLTMWTPGGGSIFCDSIDVIERNFTRLHPNIRLSKAQCATGSQDFQTVLLARIAAGNPPDVSTYWDTPVTLAVRGALEPLDNLMAHSQHSQASKWPASALASCQFGGKTWGLPLTGGSYALAYNQEWFEKKGIPAGRDSFPATWDDLRKLSKEFTSWKGDRLVTVGYIPMGDRDLIATIYVWSALNGGQLYDAQHRKYTIDAEPNIAMMEYMVSWLNEEYKGDMSKVMRSGNWSFAPDRQGKPDAFNGYRLAIVLAGSWSVTNPIAYGAKFKKWNVASFPVGPHGTKTTSGYWPNWGILPRGGHHKQEAFTFLDYLGSGGMPVWFATTPDLPANKTVSSDLVPAILVKASGEAFAVDVMRFFHHQLNISTPMWNSPIQGFATDQVLRAVNRIMYKVAKPKEALAEAQRASQNQLDQVLRSSH